jgi:hypothetical protein
MKKLLLLFIVTSAFLFVRCEGDAETTYIDPMCYCADIQKCDELCSTIPSAVNMPDTILMNGYSASFDSIHQPYFDRFSWQTFVALNWPSDTSGKVKTSDILTDENSLRVWEYYADPDTVFDSGEYLTNTTHKRKILYMSSKFGDFGFTESDGNFLIDQNLNYVVYEEKLNKVEYNYIMKHGLNTEKGQQSFTSQDQEAIKLPSGSIELKASWKILVKGEDDFSRFYHQPATIKISGKYTESGQDMSIDAEVGLIGLHIITRTSDEQKFAPFMVWSTFEHVDNVPGNLQENQKPNAEQKKYNLYSPECIGCPVNTPPSRKAKWASTMPYARNFAISAEEEGSVFGTQVVRINPIYYYTQQINVLWQEKLQGSVWENYMLVGTQWGAQQDSYPPDTVMAPGILGNCSMETFELQSSSCIQCHGRFATIAGDSTIKSDFSFLFSHAAEKETRVMVKPEEIEVKKKN